MPVSRYTFVSNGIHEAHSDDDMVRVFRGALEIYFGGKSLLLKRASIQPVMPPAAEIYRRGVLDVVW